MIDPMAIENIELAIVSMIKFMLINFTSVLRNTTEQVLVMILKLTNNERLKSCMYYLK